MSESTTIGRTEFITFYSFKGGVGRSMGLINVAGILAGRGFKVMALDMDLEAPGISYLMRQETHQEDALLPGIVDLLADACARGEEADLFALAPEEVVKRYSYPYQIPDGIRHSEEGCLRIMPAGKLDGNYQKRLDDLDLGRLYLEGLGQPLIAAVKKVITDAACFDFVFIDSRTGFSDESGICTRDLADYLVVVMGLNRQNQEGTAGFLRSLKQSGATPKGMRIVLSPVPNGEDELVDAREKDAKKILENAWGKPLDLSLQIPYHPRLALTEEPHIFRRSRGYLYEAYAGIERAVLAMVGLDPNRMKKQITEDVDTKNLDGALEKLKILVKLDDGPDHVAGVALRMKDLFKSPEARPLAEFFAATIPEESWSLRFLAGELHAEKKPLAELFYQRIVDAYPNDANNLGDYAIFLKNILKDYDRAELFYRRAIEVDSNKSNILGNFATFLTEIRKDHNQAEELYQRAIDSDPNAASIIGNFANFLTDVRRDHDRAEMLFERAVKAEPNNANCLGGFAIFLTEIRKNHDRAEVYFKRAFESNPKHANNLGNYAHFLEAIRKDYDRSEFLFQRAIEAEPQSSNKLSNFAVFLTDIRKDYDRAEELYDRAIKADPMNATPLGNYAIFLTDIRKDYNRAENLYMRAIEADPDEPIHLGNFAKLLFIQKRDEEALIMLNRAMQAHPEEKELQCEIQFYACAHAWENYPEALSTLKKLLESGARSEGWLLDYNVRAVRETGHPQPDFIEALAKVVSGSEGIQTLDRFEVWKNGRF